MGKRLAARLGDDHMCPTHGHGPVLAPGAAKVFIEGKPAALLADYVGCEGAPARDWDLIKMGAATVLAHKLPMARVTDLCMHGGSLTTSAQKVFIGGPTFCIPPNFDLDGPADFQNRAIRDLFFLSTLPTGEDLLDRLGRFDGRVKVKNLDGKRADSQHRDDDGNIVIGYDSVTQEYTTSNDRKSDIPVTPQTRLGHELVHAVREAEGTESPEGEVDPHPDAAAVDPATGERAPPPMEESQTTGSGSGRGNPTSENQLRREMGLPEREAWGNPTYPASDGANPNLRPGG